jgi:hypothetical protein
MGGGIKIAQQEESGSRRGGRWRSRIHGCRVRGLVGHDPHLVRVVADPNDRSGADHPEPGGLGAQGDAVEVAEHAAGLLRDPAEVLAGLSVAVDHRDGDAEGPEQARLGGGDASRDGPGLQGLGELGAGHHVTEHLVGLGARGSGRRPALAHRSGRPIGFA